MLINADGETNDRFQQLLDFFQKKFDADKRLCQRKQRMARALFERRDERGRSKLRGGSASEEIEDFDEPEPPSSLDDILYHNIRSRFLRLVHRRQAKDLRWDPLNPWDIYKYVHFWAYSGSTTEPPCFEDVKWRIVDAPMTTSHPAARPAQEAHVRPRRFHHVREDRHALRREQRTQPVQPYQGGAVYRCGRRNYASDMERVASGHAPARRAVVSQRLNVVYVRSFLPEASWTRFGIVCSSLCTIISRLDVVPFEERERAMSSRQSVSCHAAGIIFIYCGWYVLHYLSSSVC